MHNFHLKIILRITYEGFKVTSLEQLSLAESSGEYERPKVY